MVTGRQRTVSDIALIADCQLSKLTYNVLGLADSKANFKKNQIEKCLPYYRQALVKSS